MKKLTDFLNYSFNFSDEVQITVKTILVVIVVLFITSFVLKLFRKLLTRHMPLNDKAKFVSLFSYSKWFIYVVILLMTFNNIMKYYIIIY